MLISSYFGAVHPATKAEPQIELERARDRLVNLPVMKALLLAILVICSGAAALALVHFSRSRGNGRAPERLKAHLQARSDYVLLVGVPVNAPKRWTRVSRYTPEELVTDEETIRTTTVRAFLLAYPNYQVLDVEAAGLELPDGFTMLSFKEHPESPVRISLAQATDGLSLVDVRHGASRAHPESGDHYSTTLRSLTDEAVRVVKFGSFAEADGHYCLNTVTGQFFTADEFVSWYGAPTDGWIPAGAEVTDAENYGAPPILWVYYLETRSGDRFVTGRLLTRKWR